LYALLKIFSNSMYFEKVIISALMAYKTDILMHSF
jgi:hypothetical protein